MLAALHDTTLVSFFSGVLGLLTILTAVGESQRARLKVAGGRPVLNNLNASLRAWWKMITVFVLSIIAGPHGALVIFAILSFMAMREYMTLVPTRRGDHLTLFWSFFVIMPLQYYLIGIQRYGFFSILIPVLAFIFVPSSIAIEGDTAHFLERSAKIQFGLMVCVYCLSHAPALLLLKIPGFAGHDLRLLLYLGFIDQMNDVLQYVWGRFIGKHKIAWRVSPSPTWEGFLLGVLSATALGAVLWWATPFTPLQSASLAFAICILGSAGRLVMSAIKRDIGIKDFGLVIEKRGGILDRIDSLCFAAPIFYHLVRYYFVS
jgi:phosphatidate cytidylyltransferase